MEHFNSFTGIPRLNAKNLMIKKADYINKPLLEEIVGNSIKTGDKIIFDLDYEEFNILVDVNIFCCEKNEKNLKIEFFLKVERNAKIEILKQNIISTIIFLWNQFISIQEENNDFYLLKEFEIMGTRRKLEIMNELDYLPCIM